MAAWTVDADAAIKVVLMIPNLEWLSLCIGIDFAPEHLRHLFYKPIPNLRYLSLRFRPYVLKASCHHFLMGTYFDSVLATLATWPSAELPAVSVVQDPLEVPTSSSAQPLVFFHLYHLSVLASSPLLARTHALRLRIPGRGLASIVHSGRRPPALPCTTLLDLSTSRVSIADVSSLLRSLPRLRHLILDRCGLLDGAGPRDWAVFAYHCLLAGDALMLEYDVNRHLAAAHAGAASGAGEARPREVRVLPRALALRTLSLSVPVGVDADARRVLLAAFRRGWGEAVAMFNRSVCTARRSRAEEGVLTLRFPWPGEVGHALREHGLPGMVVVDDDDEFARLGVARDGEDCPVVCLAGQSGREEGVEHAEGCGHQTGWDIWEDTL